MKSCYWSLSLAALSTSLLCVACTRGESLAESDAFGLYDLPYLVEVDGRVLDSDRQVYWRPVDGPKDDSSGRAPTSADGPIDSADVHYVDQGGQHWVNGWFGGDTQVGLGWAVPWIELENGPSPIEHLRSWNEAVCTEQCTVAVQVFVKEGVPGTSVDDYWERADDAWVRGSVNVSVPEFVALRRIEAVGDDPAQRLVTYPYVLLRVRDGELTTTIETLQFRHYVNERYLRSETTDEGRERLPEGVHPPESGHDVPGAE